MKAYDPNFEALSTQPDIRVLPRFVPQFTLGTPGHPRHTMPMGPYLPTLLQGQVIVRPRSAHHDISVVPVADKDQLLLQVPGSGGAAPKTFDIMRFDSTGMTVTVTQTSTVFRDSAGSSLTVFAVP